MGAFEERDVAVLHAWGMTEMMVSCRSPTAART
jgi:hypothetical protein